MIEYNPVQEPEEKDQDTTQEEEMVNKNTLIIKETVDSDKDLENKIDWDN